MTLSHFPAALVFAFFTSIVFGITQRSTPKAMVRYGVYCFGMLIVVLIVASWVMYFLHR